jgi:hypothetical protein
MLLDQVYKVKSMETMVDLMTPSSHIQAAAFHDRSSGNSPDYGAAAGAVAHRVSQEGDASVLRQGGRDVVRTPGVEPRDVRQSEIRQRQAGL